jgi:hypothetical protein
MTCVKCHTPDGFRDYIGADETYDPNTNTCSTQYGTYKGLPGCTTKACACDDYVNMDSDYITFVTADVNTSTSTIDISPEYIGQGHVFEAGDAVTLSVAPQSGTGVLGKLPGGLMATTYYTIPGADDNHIKLAYTSNGARASGAATGTFTDSSISSSTITIANGHGFATGDTVQLTSTGTLPGGLALATTYYVIKSSALAIKLATTYENAVLGTKITLTPGGGGTHTVSSVQTPVTISTATCTGTCFIKYSPAFLPSDVNTSTGAITIANHPFKTGAYVQVSSSQVSPFLSYTFDASNADTSADSVTVVGHPFGSGDKLTLGGSVSFTLADPALDTISAVNHPFTTGDAVMLSGSSLPAGLPGGTYYVVVSDAYNIQLASSYANAIASTPVVVDITATGSGTLSTYLPTGLSSGTVYAIKVDANTLKFARTYNDSVGAGSKSCLSSAVSSSTIMLEGHRFATGDAVQLTTTGSLPTNLSTGTTYYVIKVDGENIKLASSYANAVAGTNLSIGGGSGTHTITSSVNPIDITAVGTGRATIVSANNYYVIKVDSNTIKLASSLANANAGAYIVPTRAGQGTHTIKQVNMSYEPEFHHLTCETCHNDKTSDYISGFSTKLAPGVSLSFNREGFCVRCHGGRSGKEGKPLVDAYVSGVSDSDTAIREDNSNSVVTASTAVTTFNATTAVDTATETITLTSMPFSTGNLVFLTGTCPTGLSTNTSYFVYVIGPTTIKLAVDATKAAAGTAVDITGTAVGTCTINMNTITYTTWPQNWGTTIGGITSSATARNAAPTSHNRPSALIFLGTTGQGGYEYASHTYSAKNAHAPEMPNCIYCHNPHSLKVQVSRCADCHAQVDASDVTTTRDIRLSGTPDYDGDGNVTEGVRDELDGIKDKLLATIVTYGTATGKPVEVWAASDSEDPDEGGAAVAFKYTRYLTASAVTSSGGKIQIAIPNHGLTTAAAVTFQGSGTLPTGLTATTPDSTTTTSYYVIVVNANAIKLASSASNASAGTAISYTDSGSGLFKLQASYANFYTVRSTKATYNYILLSRDVGYYAHNARYSGQLMYDSMEDLNTGITTLQASTAVTFNDAAVNTSTDLITLTAHGLGDKAAVVLSNSGGALPTGITAGTVYYLIWQSVDSFKLATSYDNAVAGTAMHITAAAGGGTHTIKVSPISQTSMVRPNP